LQRRLQRLIGAVTIVIGAAAIALTGAGAALAAPPPLTILASSRFVGHDGDFFISPFGDQSTYANGP
jgi:membrane-bound metal-dependent hydrolase YbcI (DUF457 family)